MDNVTAVTKIIEAAAWPIVALILGRMFRGEIRVLLSRVKGIKGLGAELALDALIEEKKTVVIQESEKVIAAQGAPVEKQIDARGSYERAKKQLAMLIRKREELTKRIPREFVGNAVESMVQTTVEMLGPDLVLSMPAQQLVEEWPLLARTPLLANNGHPLNGGVVTGLRGAGVCDEDRNLTLLGAEILIATAHQVKAMEAFKQQNPVA